MDKFKKSQILKLFIILAFLIITPLISSSLRPAYLYLVLNILIIALGAESGLLSFISTTPEEHKKPLATPQIKNDEQAVEPVNETETRLDDEQTKQKSGLLQKLNSEKFEGSVKLVSTMKKCNSMGSLVIVGNDSKEEETEEAVEFVEEDDLQENVEEISEEELYDKAETFIRDFYNELKMQREETWQKLDGVYQQSILSQ